VCALIKVTHGSEPVILGWGRTTGLSASGKFEVKESEPKVKESERRRRKAGLEWMHQGCKKLDPDHADSLIRRSVAAFRFDAAQHQLGGKWTSFVAQPHQLVKANATCSFAKGHLGVLKDANACAAAARNVENMYGQRELPEGQGYFRFGKNEQAGLCQLYKVDDVNNDTCGPKQTVVDNKDFDLYKIVPGL